MKKLLLVSAIALAVSSGAYAASDARSVGMGGIGVSTSDYLTAPVHNPALAAKYKDIDDVGLMIPSISATMDDRDEVLDKIDELQDVIDANKASYSATNAQAVIDKMQAIDGKSLSAQVQALLSVAIPNKYVASTFFVSGRLDVIAALDYSSNDTLANYNNSNYAFESFAVATGVAVVDYGIALARQMELGDGTLYYGATPKMQQVRSILYTAQIDNFEDDDFDADEYMTDETNFNMDLGVAYQLNDFTYGLTVKDLISKSYDTKARTVNGNTVKGTYKIQPVITAGASYALEYMTLGLDVDLNKSERMTSLTNVDYDTDKDDTQMAGIGAEFDAWHWAQLRLGYQWDLQNNLDAQYTAGLGLSPFDTLHLDISGSYGGEGQYGAALDIALMF